MKYLKRYYWPIIIIAAFVIAMLLGQFFNGSYTMTTPKARGEYHESLF